MQTGAEPRRTAKIAFPVDKADWHPSVLPGPIVLVSTADMRGEPNFAPKSWISTMAFRGPVRSTARPGCAPGFTVGGAGTGR
jgi:hypothetical protein